MNDSPAQIGTDHVVVPLSLFQEMARVYYPIIAGTIHIVETPDIPGGGQEDDDEYTDIDQADIRVTRIGDTYAES